MHSKKLFLAICLVALCCISCSKPEDNQGVNQGQNQGGNQGGNQVTGQKETPYQLTSSYVCTQTSYNTNPPTETTSRGDWTYDSQNRVIGIKYSSNGVVTSEYKNYVWGDKKSSNDSYIYKDDGSISVKTHYDYTYIDNQYQLTSSYVYTQTSYYTNPPTETTSRGDWTYDSQNRVIGIKYSSSNGVVTSEYKNYVWGDKKSSNDYYLYKADGSISVKIHYDYTYK